MPVIRLRFENAGKKDWKILEKINGGQKSKKPGIFRVCADLNASKVLMGKGKERKSELWCRSKILYFRHQATVISSLRCQFESKAMRFSSVAILLAAAFVWATPLFCLGQSSKISPLTLDPPSWSPSRSGDQPTEQPASQINQGRLIVPADELSSCLLYTSPSPRDKRQSRMPSSA